MLLEGLQTGIARQLAVLDDAELTEIGQSSADVLGVPGTVLADRLTGHLMREIVVRRSGGGPLTPLANLPGTASRPSIGVGRILTTSAPSWL
jgi:hypothetical protein